MLYDKTIDFFFRIGPQLQEERTPVRMAQLLGWNVLLFLVLFKRQDLKTC